MKKVILSSSCLLLMLSFVFSNISFAEDFPIITAKEIMVKMDAGEKMILLNPLSDIEFSNSHIPGSVNIPLHKIMTTDKLPQDKSTLIITYCLGPK